MHKLNKIDLNRHYSILLFRCKCKLSHPEPQFIWCPFQPVDQMKQFFEFVGCPRRVLSLTSPSTSNSVLTIGDFIVDFWLHPAFEVIMCQHIVFTARPPPTHHSPLYLHIYLCHKWISPQLQSFRFTDPNMDGCLRFFNHFTRSAHVLCCNNVKLCFPASPRMPSF